MTVIALPKSIKRMRGGAGGNGYWPVVIDDGGRVNGRARVDAANVDGGVANKIFSGLISAWMIACFFRKHNDINT